MANLLTIVRSQYYGIYLPSSKTWLPLTAATTKTFCSIFCLVTAVTDHQLQLLSSPHSFFLPMVGFGCYNHHGLIHLYCSVKSCWNELEVMKKGVKCDTTDHPWSTQMYLSQQTSLMLFSDALADGRRHAARRTAHHQQSICNEFVFCTASYRVAQPSPSPPIRHRDHPAYSW